MSTANLRVIDGRTSIVPQKEPFAPHADGERFEILEQGRRACDRRPIA